MRFFRDPAANTLMATAAVGAAFIAIAALAYGAGHTSLAILCWFISAALFSVSLGAVVWWFREPKTATAPPARASDDLEEIIDAPLTDFRKTFAEHTSVQAAQLVKIYLGKRMRVSGPLGDAEGFGAFVQVTFSVFYNLEHKEHHVFMHFDTEWADRLAMITKGTRISVVGRVKSIDAASVHLEKCELERPVG